MDESLRDEAPRAPGAAPPARGVPADLYRLLRRPAGRGGLLFEAPGPGASTGAWWCLALPAPHPGSLEAVRQAGFPRALPRRGRTFWLRPARAGDGCLTPS